MLWRLTTDQIRHIVDLQLAKLGKRLVDQRIAIEVTDAAKGLLATEGLRPDVWRPAAAARDCESD